MARRSPTDRSFPDLLLALPWWVSMALAGAAYASLHYMLPAVSAAADMAWMVAGFFTFIGLLVLAWQRTATAPAAMAESGPSGSDRTVSAGGRAEKPAAGAERQQGEIQPRPAMPADARPKPAVWSLELMQSIEWKRFEDLCQKFYEIRGIRSETTPLEPDGGIDIRLYQDENGTPTSIVQCKARDERLIGVKPVRELLVVMAREKIGKAFFMTSGKFSDEAKAFALGHRIILIDGHMFLLMIEGLPAEARQTLLSFATAGDYSTPTCPGCGVKMRRIEGRAGRPDSWGCQNYPQCRQTLAARGQGG